MTKFSRPLDYPLDKWVKLTLEEQFKIAKQYGTVHGSKLKFGRDDLD